MMTTKDRLPVADSKDVLAAVWRLIANEPRAIALILALYVLASMASVAMPVLLGQVIDGISSGWSATAINLLCAVIVACIAAQLFLSRYGRLAGYRFGERAAANLRERFMHRVLSLPLGQVEKAGTGDLGTRTSGDVAQVAQLLRNSGPEVATSIVEVLVIVAASFVVDIRLGVLMAGILVPGYFIARLFLRKSQRLFLEERTSLSESAETLTASAIGARTVDTYRLQETRHRLAHDRSADLLQKLRRIIRVYTWFLPSIYGSNRFMSYVVILMAGIWYLTGSLSLGAVIAITMLTVRIQAPTMQIITAFSRFQQGAAALARIEGVNLIAGRERTAVPSGSEVGLENVSFGYEDGPEVLHDVTLHPRRGERLVVVGPSGAGKSTIARLVAGIESPRSGRVTLGGVPVVDIPIDRMRQHVILVTQEQYVFTASVRQNLILADPDNTDDDILAALEKVDAINWVAALPEGLDTLLGREHHSLSLAQAQQLALARVILADPEVVILDEATGGIDPGSAGRVEATLAKALEGRTVIAIAHQLQAARSADRIAVVENGRIAELGSHAELQERAGTYAKLWRVWKGADIS